MRFTKNEEDKTDQHWICTLMQNSSTQDPQVKVNQKFERLPGKAQSGVTNIWDTLHTIIHITDNVIAALHGKIMEFNQKGLRSYQIKNVETARIKMVSIATCLNKKGHLLNNSTKHMITGLSKC